jgi:hypothetical protein
MRKFKGTLAAVALLAGGIAPAMAGVHGDALGKCLVESSTPADRAQFVSWFFAAATLNPAIAPYANISPAQREQIDQGMANAFTRLITQTCRAQASAAVTNEGPAAFGTAFQIFGEVAGQQLFSSPEVAAGSQGFVRFVDMNALQQSLGAAPAAPATTP